MTPDPGWRKYRYSAEVAAWARHAHGQAQAVLRDPGHAHWYRGENTWFAGVDCLPNDTSGRLPDGPPLVGEFLEDLPETVLHPAQVSAVFPGYPKPMKGETEAAARYRRTRDGAHVDGLLPIGPDRRRMIREPHAFILGLPLTDGSAEESPLVVWEGSHLVMRRAFRSVFSGHPADAWPDVDLTEVYHAARREAFETCRRVTLPGVPGEAVVLDPLMLHGIAPWTAGDGPPRLVAYFRPETDLDTWLTRPLLEGRIK